MRLRSKFIIAFFLLLAAAVLYSMVNDGTADENNVIEVIYIMLGPLAGVALSLERVEGLHGFSFSWLFVSAIFLLVFFIAARLKLERFICLALVVWVFLGMLITTGVKI